MFAFLFDPDGNIRARVITWEDGRVDEIDRLLERKAFSTSKSRGSRDAIHLLDSR